MPRIVLALAVTLALVFGVSSALSRVNDNSASFADPAGDVPNGDVTKVVVSHDSKGVVTFVVHISDWPSITSGETVVIQFDSDDPPLEGLSRAIQVRSGQGTYPGVPTLYEWNKGNPSYPIGVLPKDLSSFTWQNGIVTVKVDGRLLNVSRSEDLCCRDIYPALEFSPPKSLRFKIRSEFWREEGYPDALLRFSVLDETSTWSYGVKILRDLLVKGFSRGFGPPPKGVKVYRVLTAKMTAVRDDNGEVATGKVSCKAKIGKKLLLPWPPQLLAAATSPSAVCSWLVPKTAKGKVVKGEVTLTVPEGPRGVTETKQFSVKVK